MILSKRNTRSGNMYEVMTCSKLHVRCTCKILITQVLWLGIDSCHASWEKEENIPVDVIKEFEEQATLQINAISMPQFGKTSCTLIVDNKLDYEPQQKAKKSDRIIIEEDCG